MLEQIGAGDAIRERGKNGKTPRSLTRSLVPRELEPRLFDRFTRGDNAAQSGAGLGLSIARAYAYAHGGDLAYENVTPHGTRFELVIPIAPDLGPQPGVLPHRGATTTARPSHTIESDGIDAASVQLDQQRQRLAAIGNVQEVGRPSRPSRNLTDRTEV